VVEDEGSVRDLLVDVLRTAGHDPIAAPDGATGLAMLDPAAPPDLALIDFGLPGMSGLEVAARLRATYPAMPLVLVTGWADRLEPNAVARSGISRVVAKPFHADEILRVVAESVRIEGGGVPISGQPDQ
jgi:CheY-like chemotaxis protein